MAVARSLVVVGALLVLAALTAKADIHNLPTKWVDATSSTAPQLSTKNVVLSPAMGWLTCSGSTGGYNGTGSRYFSEESLLQDLYTNEISIRYVQEYLANAGASVYSTRERWFETPTEVIINDNDNTAAKKVTYTANSGSWSSISSAAGYGSDQHWFAGSTSESAQATFTATLTTSGYYPVYMTWPATTNRGSPDIRITHSGGIQTISVPMYQFDSIFVYLGRYYFTAAAGIKVEITNKMTTASGKLATADAVRVGCGASTAGIPRWKLSAQDFLRFMSQGQYSTMGLQVAANSAPTLDTDYLARAKFSNYMFDKKLEINFVNTQVGGDWLYAGIGATAGAGSGVSTATPSTNPSGLSAALYTACSIAADSVRLNIQQATGQNNKGGVLDSSKTELIQNTKMPSFVTLAIDVLNATEMALMAKESYRETLGRAIYKGIHKYFNSSAIIIPLPVTNLYTASMPNGVGLCWVQPTDPLESNATATAYKLYTSTDGRGWDAGVIFGPTSSSSVYIDTIYGNSVCGITTTVAVDTQYYFKVAGVNAGGEALTKLTVAGYRNSGARPRVLVVDAFDADFIHTSDNIEGRYTREYVFEYVTALQAAGYRCDSATKNTLLDPTWVNDYLVNYDTVIWFAGENTGIDVFPAAHQAVINTWIAAATFTNPRSLIVSGSHVASGLAAAGGASATFLANNLGAGYAGATASAPFIARQAVDPGFTMSGTVTFNSVIALGGPFIVQTPDILTTVGNGMAALFHGSSGGNIAGVSTVGGSYSSFLLAMPFETIKSSTERTTLMTSIVKSMIQRRASSAISAATASSATVASISRASVATLLSAASASAISTSFASFASEASVASQLSAASASAISSSVASLASEASDANVASTSIAFVTSAASAVIVASVASVASDASAASTSVEFVTSAASVASVASAASTSVEYVASVASASAALRDRDSSDSASMTAIVAASVSVVGVCLIVLAVVLVRRRRSRRAAMTPKDSAGPIYQEAVEMEILPFPQATQSRQEEDIAVYAVVDKKQQEPLYQAISTTSTENVYDNESVYVAGGNSRRIRDGLTIVKHLASGNFGDVALGQLPFSALPPRAQNLLGPAASETVQVAVKSLKSDADDKSRKDFESEAKLMAPFVHPNVVRLLAALVESEPHLVLLEFVQYGDLRTLLQKSQKQSFEWTQNEQVHAIRQIALGMEYLGTLHFVHRDLAARNCLVGQGMVVKIADFGLSRELEDENDYYRVQTRGKLPVKWMAPETMTFRKFSTMSDVWSFGVTSWECFTYGATPYDQMDWRETLAHIEAGGRLPQPEACVIDLYNMMLSCWNMTPEFRPSFSQLVKVLAGFEDGTTIREIGAML